MKKIFTMFFALLALAFSVKAQVPVFTENFDSGMPTGWTQIDANNDNMGWEHSSNPASYFAAGTDLSGNGHNSSTGFVLSGSYSNVTNQAITPDNWLVSPAINLTSNANLTFWVCAQDANYAAEHYGVYITTGSGTTTTEFTQLMEETIDANGGARVQGAWKQKTVNLASYTGQTVRIAFRHFNCNDMFVLNLDDVEVLAQPTGPTIIVNPTSVNFGMIAVGSTQTQDVDVVAYNLTAAVTATTTAPFSVSADGTTFSTTASVAAAGGTLYVQYAPTATGANNGTVTLASTGASDVTLTLTGEGIDCSNNPLPYSYSFTSDAANQCWEVINANNDDYTFEFNTTDGYASIRYNSTLAMDDWLISPAFTLTGGQSGSVDYRSGSSSWFEKLQIFAIGASDTVALTPVIEAHNTTFETVYFDLSSLTGNYQIAIHGISDADQLRLYVTNVNVFNGAPTSSMDVNPTALDFGTVPSGANSGIAAVVVHTVNLNEAITLSTAAPFEISLNGTTFAATQTIPANSSLVVDDTVYVRFAPTTAGTFSQNLTVTATSLNGTVALTGTAVTCNVITTFPFTETFDEDSPTRPCWMIVDANNDNFTIEYLPYDDYNTGVAAYFYNSSNNANDWLISPEMTLPAGATFLSYEYAIASSSYPEKYSVWVIPENGTYATATNILPTQTVDETGTLTNILDLSSYANQTIRVAFKVESDADEYYIYFDNVSVMAAGEASLTVDPTSMYFTGNVGAPTMSQAAQVLGLSLSNNVTITATAPFEVSTNGATYASSATIAQATIINTPIYVRMNATTAGSQSGTVTLTSGTATATINVSGNAVDCSQPQALPFVENFENDLTECWQNIDNDGDGYYWQSSMELGIEGYESSACYMSASYDNNFGPLTPDNWLITPALSIPAQGAKLTWYVAAQDPNWPSEFYEVKISTSPNFNSFTSIFNETLESGEWEQRTVNINGNWAGQTVYIAFQHHNSTDMYMMKIDDLNVTPGVGVENHEVNTTIYPNPANNVLNINSTSNINRVEVYNMMGQLVGTYNANDVNTQINTSRFANGVYTVKIETENGTSTQKFTVAR